MKKNSTLLLILTVLVLAGVAYWVMKTDDSAGGGKAMSDFAIENTEDIDKIIIKEINGNKAELEKKEGVWRVNEKYNAREENVNLLLKTFKNISVQSAVSYNMKQTVVANMAARHKKVEIYINGDLEKTYYVGSPTKDHYGTYMLLEKNGRKSTEPYVMHIPGFNGFLESRFFTNLNDWKYSGVFVYDPLEIEKINVSFTNKPSKSYIITQTNKAVQLKDNEGKEVEKYNKTLVENYILNYEKIFFNKVAELPWEKADSIINSTPTYTVSVTGNGKKKKVNFHLKPKDNPEIDIVTGEIDKWDENYIYGVVEGENEVLIFQYFALGNVFSDIDFFLQK